MSSFSLSTSKGLTLPEGLQSSPDHTVLVYTHIDILQHLGSIPVSFMNRTSWKPQDEPLIQVSRDQWDANQFVPEIPENAEWIDLVVNNRDDKGHPFHLVSSPLLLY